MKFGLEFIKKLKPVRYRFKAPLNDGREHFGFIAQDINKIASKEDYAFVSTKNLYKDGENGEFLAIDYKEFVAPMVKAIQELSKRVEKLEKKK
jgi:hypothetical protein